MEELTKKEALAEELGVVEEDVIEKEDNVYEVDGREYLVLTDEEANELYYKKELDSLKKKGIYALPWEFREYLKDEVLDADKLEELELKLTKKGLLDLFKEDFDEYKQELINGGYIDEDNTYTKEELKDFITEMAEDMVYNNYESSADSLENDFGEEDFWKLIVKAEVIDYNTVIEEFKNWSDYDRGELLADYDHYEDMIDGTPYYYYRLK